MSGGHAPGQRTGGPIRATSTGAKIQIRIIFYVIKPKYEVWWSREGEWGPLTGRLDTDTRHKSAVSKWLTLTPLSTSPWWKTQPLSGTSTYSRSSQPFSINVLDLSSAGKHKSSELKAKQVEIWVIHPMHVYWTFWAQHLVWSTCDY